MYSQGLTYDMVPLQTGLSRTYIKRGTSTNWTLKVKLILILIVYTLKSAQFRQVSV